MTTYPIQSGTWTWTLDGEGEGRHPPADALAALQGLVMVQHPGVRVVDWFLEAPENHPEGTEQAAVMTVALGETMETLHGSLRLRLERTAVGGRIHWSFQAIGTRGGSEPSPCIPGAKSYPRRG